MTTADVNVRDGVLFRPLLDNYVKYGDSGRIAMRKKDLGRWQSYTWDDYYENTRWVGAALLGLGLELGDKVAIIGDNDPELLFAEMGSYAVGGVIVVLFVDCTPDEIKYVLNHSGTKIIFAKDQEAVDKVLSIADDVPTLKRIIYWDPKGLWDYTEPLLLSWESLIEMGQRVESEQAGLFVEAAERLKPDDLANLVYTSGTTGLPKSVMYTHRSALGSVKTIQSFWPVLAEHEELLYTSPAWAAGQNHIWRHTVSGHTLNFPENVTTVQENIREIAPHTIFYPARLWEDLIRSLNREINDSGALNRIAYRLALGVGYKVAECHFNKVKPSLFLKAAYGFWYRIVFRQLQDYLGLIRVVHAFTGGGSLGPDSFKYLRALGLNIKQVYGATEVTFISAHADDDVKFESVGKGVGEGLKLTEEGEIVARDEGMLVGYFKDPELYEKSVRDGWFHTGDAGYVDNDGHLIFWDRLSDLRELTGGAKFSPLYIESRLRFSPYIRDAVCVGGGRDYVAVLVAIDFENTGKWAERRKIPYTTFVDLSQRPEILDLVRVEIQRVNDTLPDWSKVVRLVNLPKELDPDEAELTRTRKLRRGLVEDRYREIIEALYAGQEEVATEVKVQYRDGTEKFIRADLHIVTV